MVAHQPMAHGSWLTARGSRLVAHGSPARQRRGRGVAVAPGVLAAGWFVGAGVVVARALGEALGVALGVPLAVALGVAPGAVLGAGVVPGAGVFSAVGPPLVGAAPPVPTSTTLFEGW